MILKSSYIHLCVDCFVHLYVFYLFVLIFFFCFFFFKFGTFSLKTEYLIYFIYQMASFIFWFVSSMFFRLKELFQSVWIVLFNSNAENVPIIRSVSTVANCYYHCYFILRKRYDAKESPFNCKIETHLIHIGLSESEIAFSDSSRVFFSSVKDWFRLWMR